MISAVVLVNTNVGEEFQVLERVKKVKEVQEVIALWGVYDIMVKIKAQTMDRLKEIIKLELRKLAGVVSVLTLMLIENSGGLSLESGS